MNWKSDKYDEAEIKFKGKALSQSQVPSVRNAVVQSYKLLKYT